MGGAAPSGVSTVSVSGLPHGWGEAQLCALAQRIGDVEELLLLPPSPTTPTLAGFVRFAKHEDAVTAVRMLSGIPVDAAGPLVTPSAVGEPVVDPRTFLRPGVSILEVTFAPADASSAHSGPPIFPPLPAVPPPQQQQHASSPHHAPQYSYPPSLPEHAYYYASAAAAASAASDFNSAFHPSWASRGSDSWQQSLMAGGSKYSSTVPQQWRDVDSDEVSYADKSTVTPMLSAGHPTTLHQPNDAPWTSNCDSSRTSKVDSIVPDSPPATSVTSEISAHAWSGGAAPSSASQPMLALPGQVDSVRSTSGDGQETAHGALGSAATGSVSPPGGDALGAPYHRLPGSQPHASLQTGAGFAEATVDRSKLGYGSHDNAVGVNAGLIGGAIHSFGGSPPRPAAPHGGAPQQLQQQRGGAQTSVLYHRAPNTNYNSANPFLPPQRTEYGATSRRGAGLLPPEPPPPLPFNAPAYYYQARPMAPKYYAQPTGAPTAYVSAGGHSSRYHVGTPMDERNERAHVDNETRHQVQWAPAQREQNYGGGDSLQANALASPTDAYVPAGSSPGDNRAHEARRSVVANDRPFSFDANGISSQLISSADARGITAGGDAASDVRGGSFNVSSSNWQSLQRTSNSLAGNEHQLPVPMARATSNEQQHAQQLLQQYHNNALPNLERLRDDCASIEDRPLVSIVPRAAASGGDGARFHRVACDVDNTNTAREEIATAKDARDMHEGASTHALWQAQAAEQRAGASRQSPPRRSGHRNEVPQQQHNHAPVGYSSMSTHSAGGVIGNSRGYDPLATVRQPMSDFGLETLLGSLLCEPGSVL